MKNILVTTLLCFLFIDSQCQKMVCSLNSGYASGYILEAYQDTSSYYTAEVQHGIKYGMNLGYNIDRYFSVDLLLQYQNTLMPVDIHYSGSSLLQTLQVKLLWVEAGGTSYLPAGHLEFIIGTYIGIGLYHFSDFQKISKNSPVRFAWSVRGGFNFFFTKAVGLHFGADGLFSTDPLKKQFATPGLSDGNTGFSYFFQFSLSGGIIVRLFGTAKKSK